MISKLICKLLGHKRHKRVAKVGELSKVMRCPRCGHEKAAKAK